VLGGHNSTVIELETVHPLWFPFRYSVYGTWLIGSSIDRPVGGGVGRWSRRLPHAGAWTLVGVGFAVAITWPRWVSEYHWANSETNENANQIAAATESLELARSAMPQFEHTRRYWVARGRLEYRQHRDSDFVAYFKASQHVLQDKRTWLVPSLSRNCGGPAARLQSEICWRR